MATPWRRSPSAPACTRTASAASCARWHGSWRLRDRNRRSEVRNQKSEARSRSSVGRLLILDLRPLLESLLMPKGCSDQAPPAPLTREAAEALAAKLVAEMIQQWRQGERLLPEDFLARHPQLWEHPAAAADLIYEELCLRQEHGPEVPVEQVLRRFPQWRPQLGLLFDCQRVL